MRETVRAFLNRFVFQKVIGFWLLLCLVLYASGILGLLHGKVILCGFNHNTVKDVTDFFKGVGVMLFMSSGKAFKMIFQSSVFLCGSSSTRSLVVIFLSVIFWGYG